jgi:hypothetical protein
VPSSWRSSASDPSAVPSRSENIAGSDTELTANESNSSNDSVGAIAAKYDLRNISPREIDQLGQELQSSGYKPLLDLAVMTSYGEEFLSHDPFGSYTESQMTQKGDLIAKVEEEREAARSSGAPTEAYDQQLAFLDRLQEAGREHRTQVSQGRGASTSEDVMGVLLSYQEI